MEEASAGHVVIINRNYPPRQGVTGESAQQLAQYLQEHHHKSVSIVTVRSSYAGGGGALEPVGTVYEIDSLFEGKQKLLRLVSSFIESWRLIWRAKRLGGDHYIVMTDPPFLSLWAVLMFTRDTPWTLWAMDLYPDAFHADQLVSRRNVAYRIMRRVVYGRPPGSLIALGPLQAEYIHRKYRRQIPTALIPCGIHQNPPAADVPRQPAARSSRSSVASRTSTTTSVER